MFEIEVRTPKRNLMRLSSVAITARELRKAKIKVGDTSLLFSKAQQFCEQNDLLTGCFLHGSNFIYSATFGISLPSHLHLCIWQV